MTTPETTPVEVQTDIRKVESWQDVDRALGVLRGIDARLETIGAGYDEQIAALQAGKQKDCQALLRRRERVEGLVSTFAQDNRGDLPKGRKSMKLVHGIVGWKKGRKRILFTKGEDYTKSLAERRGLDSLLNRTVKLDKAALKKLKKGEQIALGVRIGQSEDLYIKLSSDPAIDYPDAGAQEDGQ